MKGQEGTVSGSSTTLIGSSVALDGAILLDKTMRMVILFCGFFLLGSCLFGQNLSFNDSVYWKAGVHTSPLGAVQIIHSAHKFNAGVTRVCTSAGIINFLSNEDAYYGNTIGSSYSVTVSPLADSKATRAADKKWAAFILNWLLGAGIGSFVQGDTAGGLVGLCGEAAGLILLLVGATPEEQLIYHHGYDTGYYTTGITYPNERLAYVGLGVFFSTRVFELIRPFNYASRSSVVLMPVFDAHGQLALAAMVQLKK